MCNACTPKLQEIIDTDVKVIVDPYMERHPDNNAVFNDIKNNLMFVQANAVGGMSESYTVQTWNTYIKRLSEVEEKIKKDAEAADKEEAENIALEDSKKNDKKVRRTTVVPNKFVPISELLLEKAAVMTEKKKHSYGVMSYDPNLAIDEGMSNIDVDETPDK